MRIARPGLLACALLSLAGGCTEPRFAGALARPGRCPATLDRAAAPAAGVVVSVACVHYEVEGDTAEGLARSMDERGPRDDSGRYHGYTLFDLSYGYDEREGPGTCGATSILVRLELVHVLPVLGQGLRLDPALSTRWERFTDRLAVHESGHGKLDAGAAVQLFEALGGLAPEPSCAALRRRAHDVFDGLIRELRREHRFYDMRTGHGKAQGARFP